MKKQNILIGLLLTVFTLYASPAGDDIAGTWEGVLTFGENSLKLVIHVKQGDDGLTASLDSPDQNAFGVPVDSVACVDGTLSWSVNAIQAGFKGNLAEEGQCVRGTFTQRGVEVPLELKKMAEKE